MVDRVRLRLRFENKVVGRGSRQIQQAQSELAKKPTIERKQQGKTDPMFGDKTDGVIDKGGRSEPMKRERLKVHERLK